MTSDRLIEAIREVPGINHVQRWTKYGKDHLYLFFSVSTPSASVFVDLACGVLFGFPGTWDADPNDLGERAVRAVQVLCRTFREEKAKENADARDAQERSAV